MSFVHRADIVSWGRTSRIEARVVSPSFRDEVGNLVREGSQAPHRTMAFGLRRSYGDSCLNEHGSMIDMTGLNRFIHFDRQTGRLAAEAGASFDDILKLIVPAGFFLPVTPGTKFVTLGGAIANDVHGKNHHSAGTIGRWVRQLQLLRSDGALHTLTPDDPTGLFAATIGGLGLTGVIVSAELELIPITSANLDTEVIPFGNVGEFLKLSAESEQAYTYTVAWVDCLGLRGRIGQGIFTRARHSDIGPLKVHTPGRLTIPMEAPGFCLNRYSLLGFNTAYRFAAGLKHRKTTHYEPFFYPLDAIGQWNLLYGRKGFFQYQCVVPSSEAEPALTKMLQAIAASGEGSFLSVLKTFGNVASPGLLSFPMEGATLAMDFPNRATTSALFDRLDDIVRSAGGRLYPAKDGRISANMYKAGYPHLERFTAHIDPGFSSSFSRRVGL